MDAHYTDNDGYDVLSTDVKDVLIHIEQNAFNTMRYWRQEMVGYDKGYHEVLYGMIVCAYAFAREAQESHEVMKVFLECKEFPPRKKKREAKNILRLSIQFLLSAGDNGPMYNRACAYERAVRPFFEARVAPIELVDRIFEGGGLEELNRQASIRAHGAKLRREKAGEPSPSPDINAVVAEAGGLMSPSRPTQPSLESEDDDSDDNTPPKAGPKAAKAHGGGTIAEEPSRRGRRFVFDSSKHLAIHATPEQIGALTGGTTFRAEFLTVEISEARDGWNEIHLSRIGRPSSR